MPAITLLESDIVILNHALAFLCAFHPYSWRGWHSWWILPCMKFRERHQARVTDRRDRACWPRACGHVAPFTYTWGDRRSCCSSPSGDPLLSQQNLLLLQVPSAAHGKAPQPISAQISGPCLRGCWVNLCYPTCIQVHSWKQLRLLCLWQGWVARRQGRAENLCSWHCCCSWKKDAHTVAFPGSGCSIKRLKVALVNKQKTSTGKAGRSSQQKLYSAVKREEAREAKGNNSLLV